MFKSLIIILLKVFTTSLPYTINNQNVIIAAIKSRLKFATHKYGVEIPSSIEHYIFLDAFNCNRLWKEVIDKDIHNVSVSFEILPTRVPVSIGWKKSSRHLISDVNLDFSQKARWVKDGHCTPDPKESNYAGVVSRYNVRIVLTYASLHDVDVTAVNIKNAYLQALSSEKHYVICRK